MTAIVPSGLKSTWGRLRHDVSDGLTRWFRRSNGAGPQPLDEFEETRYVQRERRIGRFARSITLPGPVDPAGLKTTQREGILTVEVPKAKDS